MPIAIAAVVVVIAAGAVIAIMERGNKAVTAAPVNAAADPYAVNLQITGLEMSESANLAGGKVTYVDGQVSNKGERTVTGISMQVLFRDSAQEVAQNDPPQQLKVIRTREPYIDVEPLSVVPLKPGEQRDFRLIFDRVVPDWDGAMPQLRILHVQFQ